MDMGIVLRIGAGVVVVVSGLILASSAQWSIRISAEQVGLALIVGGVLFAYYAVKAHYDANDQH
jgi:uncharacterized membrane protein HdeD (DUF308 family)